MTKLKLSKATPNVCYQCLNGEHELCARSFIKKGWDRISRERAWSTDCGCWVRNGRQRHTDFITEDDQIINVLASLKGPENKW